MMLASELGQKYATQNYPSQGTPICKLHGPSIKPRIAGDWGGFFRRPGASGPVAPCSSLRGLSLRSVLV